MTKWRNFLCNKTVRRFSNVVGSIQTLESLATSRSLIRIRGDQVQPFLQALITNDINHVAKDSTGDSMFTMFLNKAGRVLYDAIIYKTSVESTFFIECDKRVDNDLRKHMMLFRIRKKIDIDIVNDEFRLWTMFNPKIDDSVLDVKHQEIPVNCGVVSCYSDPRLKLLGTRLIAPAGNTAADITNALPSAKISSDGKISYAQHRYRLGVGEGIDELPPEKSFPFEANCDYMHGISFHKGCYLGQEFTARTYHTGVIRKRLMPIEIKASSPKPLSSEELLATQITSADGKALGKLRGLVGNSAIGLLRIDQALQADLLHFNGCTGTTQRPKWWPTEAPKQI